MFSILYDHLFESYLPEKLNELAEAVSHHYQIDINITIPVILSLASGLVHDKFQVKLYDPKTKGSFIEPLSLFCIGIAASSERKSSVFKCLRSPIDEIVRKKNIESEDSQLVENAKRELAEDKIKKIKKKLLSLEEGTPDYIEKQDEFFQLKRKLQQPQSSLLRLFLQDTTAIAAAEFMKKHPGNAAIIADGEGAFFDALLSDHRLLEVLLRGESNETISFDRMPKSSVVELPKPHICLGVLTQHEKLKRIAQKQFLWNEGFIPRCLFFICQSRAGSRTTAIGPSIPPEITEWWKEQCYRYISLPYQESNVCHTLELSQDACLTWCECSMIIENKINSINSFTLKSWYGKMKGVVARIAAIYHLLESDNPLETKISKQHMINALEMINHIAQHMDRIAIIYDLQNDKTIETMCKIIKYIHTHSYKPERISLRVIYRNLNLKLPIASAACERLCATGMFTLIPALLTVKGRPSSPDYQVNYIKAAELYQYFNIY